MYCINCGKELPDEAMFCMYCGCKIEKKINPPKPTGKPDYGNRLTLSAFRNGAIEDKGYREQLIALRKSLQNSWDYNAYMGILLGVAGPKHGDAACMNYAIGQGDNGNNTKKTLEAKGLMPIFEKYKGKKLDSTITLDEVENEIILAVPEYRTLRDKIHAIIDTGTAVVTVNPPTISKPEPDVKRNDKEGRSVDEYIEALIVYLEYKFNCMIMSSPEHLVNALNPYSMHNSNIDIKKYEWIDRQGRKVSDALTVLAKYESDAWIKDNYESKDMSMLGAFFSSSYPFYAENRKIDEFTHEILMSGLGILSDKYKNAGLLLGYIKNTFYSLKDTIENNNKYFFKKAIVVDKSGKTQYSDDDFTYSNSMAVYTDDEYKRGTSVLRGNVVDYKGRIYYIAGSGDNLRLVRRMLDSDIQAIKFYEFGDMAAYGLGVADSMHYPRNTNISIAEDVLYVGDGNRIIAINLMGLNIIDTYEVTVSTKRINLCIALGGKIVYGLETSSTLYMYDLASGKSEKFMDRRDITGYTVDGWLNFGNELLVQVNTGEKINVQKQFKLKKDKRIIFINIYKKIAYYYEEDETYYLRSRIIGVDINGNIADEWKLPRLQLEVYSTFFKDKGYLYLDSSYYGLYFDGEKIVVKLNASEKYSLPQCVLEYDRNGNLCDYTVISEKGGMETSFGECFTMIRSRCFFLKADGVNNYCIQYIDNPPDKGKVLRRVDKFRY